MIRVMAQACAANGDHEFVADWEKKAQELEVPGDTGAAGERPAQSLDDWTRVYEGLSDDQIEQIDEVAKTRAKLTRNLP